jgi:hypothetical protein
MDMNIAILEGKWFDDKNVSVEPLFHVLGDLLYKEAHPYYYHMVDDSSTFSDLINYVFRKRGMKYLHVAAHGDNKGITGTNDGHISRASIKNAFNRVRSPKDGGTYGSLIEGAFFGSCNFMTKDNAKYLLDSTHVKWVAGYSKNIDWIGSSMVDIIFWQMFLKCKEKRPINRIKCVCDEFTQLMPMYVANYGFNVYVRRKGRNSDAVSCFSDILEIIEEVENTVE